MTTQRVYAQNQISGVVALVPARYLSHPVLGANLREVRNGKVRGRLSEIIKPDEPKDIEPNEPAKVDPDAKKAKDE